MPGDYVVRSVKSNSFWGSAPDPAGGAYGAPPDPLAGLSSALKNIFFIGITTFAP
jgi:hypothetical protein